MKHTTSRASPMRSAYHWSVAPGRGLKSAVIEPVGGLPAGVGVAARFRALSAAVPGSVRVSLNGGAPAGGGCMAWQSAFQ